ncbi:putative exported protein, partial [Yersinia pestis PY-05]
MRIGVRAKDGAARA